MDKKGEGGSSLSTNELIGFILTLLFIIAVSFIIGKAFLNKGCPAGYDIIEKTEFNPSIEKICGADNSEDVLCCSRKSDPLQVCKYYREDKRFACEKLAQFNSLQVCGDNTACGVSTSECSGGYCEKGVCLVKEGVGKCVEKFDIDGKEVIVNEDSCEKEFDGIFVGSSCNGIRHCIFDAFTRNGKCLGGYFNVNIEDARSECERYCADARDDVENPLNSRYCTAKLPIYVEGESKPVDTYCYNAPINVECSVLCKAAALIPQE